jgi:hypothetical protein
LVLLINCCAGSGVCEVQERDREIVLIGKKHMLAAGLATPDILTVLIRMRVVSELPALRRKRVRGNPARGYAARPVEDTGLATR